MNDPLQTFFIATGSNLGNKKANLFLALTQLQLHFQLVAQSRIYESPAVDYLNQPDFYNQVLEFELPLSSPEEAMALLLKIEKEMGRNRIIPKGPRLIDLDILFWGELQISNQMLQIPHPRLFERSFVVYPLSELPGFSKLKTMHTFRLEFDNSATALS